MRQSSGCTFKHSSLNESKIAFVPLPVYNVPSECSKHKEECWRRQELRQFLNFFKKVYFNYFVNCQYILLSEGDRRIKEWETSMD